MQHIRNVMLHLLPCFNDQLTCCTMCTAAIYCHRFNKEEKIRGIYFLRQLTVDEAKRKVGLRALLFLPTRKFHDDCRNEVSSMVVH
jgi:hypothetical protein